MSDPLQLAVQDLDKRTQELEMKLRAMKEARDALARLLDDSPPTSNGSVPAKKKTEPKTELTSREVVRGVFQAKQKPLSRNEITEAGHEMFGVTLNQNTLYWALSEEMKDKVLVREGDKYRLVQGENKE